MINLSFSAAALRSFDVMQAIHLVGEGGYRGVEIELGDAHLHPIKSSKLEIKRAQKHCEILGLSIAGVAATGPDLSDAVYGASLITASRLGRQRRMGLVRRTLELAQTLSSPALIINSGPLDPQTSRRQAEEYLLQALYTLQPALGETVLAIEPEPGCLIDTTAMAIELVEKLSSPNIRLCLNIAHLFCEGGGGYPAIAQALPHTRHIHISDTAAGQHRHDIPGEGDINFMRVHTALAGATILILSALNWAATMTGGSARSMKAGSTCCCWRPPVFPPEAGRFGYMTIPFCVS